MKHSAARAQTSAESPSNSAHTQSKYARPAVDEAEQGRGLGSALRKNALQRAYAGAEIIGGRAVLVHAIDAEAAAFYRKCGFESCPGLELHLMLVMKDLRGALGA